MTTGDFKRILWTALLVVAACTAVGREPANLGPHKDELIAYQKSGEYDREIASVAAEARSWVEQRAARQAGGERLVVIFDLDETLLSNWPQLEAEKFGGSGASWAAWWTSAKCPVIAPVRDVYDIARKLAVEVIFITGRPERVRAATEQNLQNIGCSEFAALICKPNDSKDTMEKFKAAARARLSSEGRTIIANIGDQESDLSGGYSERTFKLPNPFYFSR
jgi:acid phosphatase